MLCSEFGLTKAQCGFQRIHNHVAAGPFPNEYYLGIEIINKSDNDLHIYLLKTETRKNYPK